MKKIRRDLEAIRKGLQDLAKRTDSVLEQLEKLEDKIATTSGKSVTAKPVRKPSKKKSPTATEVVLKIINKSKRGVDTKKIQEKTGFNTRKIWDIVHKAYKEGKISKVGRGLYVGKS